jgi:hypothetical protein
MSIKLISFAIVAMGLSSQAWSVGDNLDRQGYNLCKRHIQEQYRGPERINLNRAFYRHESREDGERTFYINGGHWQGDQWTYDRVTCVTSLNGRKLISMDRARGRFARRIADSQDVETVAQH